MNIQIGAKLSIKLEEPGGHITALYVGVKTGDHIVLTFLEKKSAYIEKIKDLNEIKVQYFENDVRYEFRGKVIKVLEEPVDLIVIGYPSDVQSIDKRNLDRINCLVSAKLKKQSNTDTPPVVGVIENINKSGCLCNMTKNEGNNVSFSMGDRVDLKCQFPGLLGEQNAEGKIVRIQEEGKDLVLGINFDKEIWWVPPYDRK